MRSVYVVVQLYPWLKFYLPFFQTHYHTYKGTYNKISPKLTAVVPALHSVLFHYFLPGEQGGAGGGGDGEI